MISSVARQKLYYVPVNIRMPKMAKMEKKNVRKRHILIRPCTELKKVVISFLMEFKEVMDFSGLKTLRVLST
jgi:hypothetical protein